MKRLLKFFAFLGGLGAIGWLVRHRFVGMTLNREPQTPEPATEPATEEAVEEDSPATDLVAALGVSAEEAECLDSAGISTVKQLAIADAKDLAEKTELEESRLLALMEQAAALV